MRRTQAMTTCRGTSHCERSVEFTCAGCKLPLCVKHGEAWTQCGPVGGKHHRREGEQARRIARAPMFVADSTLYGIRREDRAVGPPVPVSEPRAMPAGGRRVDLDRYARIAEMRSGGASVAEIHRVTGASPMTITKACKRAGLPAMRYNGRRTA